MAKNKTALEVNTDSDTSKSMEQKTDQIADSKLSDKDQVNDRTDSDSVNDSLEDRDTQNSADDSIKGLDKTAEDNGNGYKAEVNDSCKNMTDTRENHNKTVKDSPKDNNSNSDIVDTDNSNAVDTSNKAKSNRFDFRQYNASLTPEERRERARIAGIASGQARRERRTLGEELTAILSEGDNQKRLCMALFTSALSGNYKAFNSLRDTIGEMPTQKQEVTTNMTEGDRELLENVQKRLKEQDVTK